MLSKTELIHEARRKTGLSDFGTPSGFDEALTVLINAYNREAHCTDYDLITRIVFERQLCNQLLIQHCVQEHPEIAEIEIQTPIFIVGVPRTGTTLLQMLLARDPTLQTLSFWEARRPAPWVDEEPAGIQRIREAELELAAVHGRSSRMRTIHYNEAMDFFEDGDLLCNSFMSPKFALYGHIEGYLRWLEQRDLEPTYRYHKRQLQLIQWQRARGQASSRDGSPPARWLLKCPFHLFAPRAILEVYPDARLIMTQRDPQEYFPSVCSLVATLRGVFRSHVDPCQVSDDWLCILQYMMHQYDRARGEACDRFFEISYARLMDSPIGTIRSLYDFLDRGFSPDHGMRMEAWLRANPQGLHGTHVYSLDRFKLTPEALNRLQPSRLQGEITSGSGGGAPERAVSLVVPCARGERDDALEHCVVEPIDTISHEDEVTQA